MAEVLPMKIYTIWNENEKPEIRRCEVAMRDKLKFVTISEILYTLFPKLQQKVFNVYWKDSESDDILISSDHELDIAVAQMSDLNLLKLYVQCKDDQPKDEVINITVTAGADTACGNDMLHAAVVCDGCESSVSGFRYKCIVCDDYDLCGKCESSGVHPQHCMIRISMPDMERANIRTAMRNSRAILKAMQAEANKRSRECRERSNERRHRAGGDSCHRRERGHRKQRGSWFDTFASYMNEFANLAGDIPFEPELKKEQDKKEENAPTSSQPEQATPQRNPDWEKKKEDTEKIIREQMKSLFEMRAKNMENYMNEIPDCVKNWAGLNPFNEIQNHTEKNDKAHCSKESEEKEKSESPRKSLERADDWTVIDSDKDSSVMADISEGIKDSKYVPSIYPPLNMSTAVLNPKAPREHIIPVEISPGPSNSGNGAIPKPTAPKLAEESTQAKPKPATTPLPKRAAHPVPQIEAAIQQMMAMGFTNDGGWLTQLLESKQGDIAAVLDLLTPANIKK